MRSTASRRRATAASRFSLESDHFLAYRRDPVNDTLTMLRTRRGALLAELHAHTTWSDGSLALPGLVDLYGSRGFDVLCITDHVCRTDLADAPEGITAANYGAYLAEIDHEARRARERYDLLVVPGLVLTHNDPDPARLGPRSGCWASTLCLRRRGNRPSHRDRGFDRRSADCGASLRRRAVTSPGPTDAALRA
jgi:hypothetical protein